METCVKDGCEGSVKALGLCARHYSTEYARRRRAEKAAEAVRICSHCGGRVGTERRPHGPVIYCSRRCKELAWVASGKANEAAARARYKRRYGMTPAEAAVLQAGACAICGTTNFGGRYGKGVIDHCHTRGHVRGVLCTQHNVGLGMFGDDPALLRAAADYLERGVV